MVLHFSHGWRMIFFTLPFFRSCVVCWPVFKEDLASLVQVSGVMLQVSRLYHVVIGGISPEKHHTLEAT